MNKGKFFVTTPIYLAHEVVAGNWRTKLDLSIINQPKLENYDQR